MRRRNFFPVVVAFTFTLALVAPAASQHVHDGGSGLDHGIPDFCAGPTIRSVASGNWSNPGIWNPAGPPAAGAKVEISAGNAVTYDVMGAHDLDCVGVKGILRFRTDASTRLRAGVVMVMDEGTLEVGKEGAPIAANATAEIVIANQPLNTSFDPEQFGTGLIGFGRVIMHGQPRTPTFVRLAQEVFAGQNVLHLSAVPAGWAAGDRLLLPDTRQLRYSETRQVNGYVPQWEVVTIASISGTQIALTAPVQFNHHGARNTLTDALDFLPHVGNLSRNVIVKSASPTGTRGHGVFSQRADVDIRYTFWQSLGRTTVQPLDNTTFDSSGNVTHVGTNQIGKYPIHFHHVMGPITPPANGYQFTLIGNAIEDTTKWAIAIHNSHFGLVQENVVFQSQGAGISTEDGSESRNVIAKNFVVGSWGTGGAQAEGREGTAFWFRGVDNYVRDNVAANILSDGPDSGYGYKYFLVYLGDVKIPLFPGADTLDPGQVEVRNSHAMAVREFKNNEVYGATESGLTYWWIGAINTAPVPNAPESVFKDTTAWNVHNKGVFHYPAQSVTIDGFVMRSTNPGGDSACCQLGIDFGDYYGKSISLKNLDIQGRMAAITGSPITDSTPVLIENALFATQFGVEIQTMWNVNYNALILKPRKYTLKGVKHVFPGHYISSAPAGAVVMSYYGGGNGTTLGLTVPDEVLAVDWNQVPGDTFRIYYTQQAPGFIVPETVSNPDGTPKVLGSPVAGLTNTQNWNQYGIAIAGAVAPCQTTKPGIVNGFACATSASAPAAPTGVHIVSQD
jgi:G8 domain